MAQRILRPDATIEDVLDTLHDREGYVRTILGHMAACRSRHGNASVRIGITGKGREPSHKVMYVDADGNELLFDAFGGTVSFGDSRVHEDTWSTSATTFEEVKSLIGKIRGFISNKNLLS